MTALLRIAWALYWRFTAPVIDWLAPRKRRAMPSVQEFARMGPERATEWHRRAGIEARVAAALAETDRP